MSRTDEKADVTHFYHKIDSLFASLYSVQDIFHVFLGAHASIFLKAVYADIMKLSLKFMKTL